MASDPTSKLVEPAHLERLDPNDRSDHQAAQHWARYEFACQFLPAARVLDCACGLGYGTALLKARGASHCVGVDVSTEAIASARQRYGRPDVEFISDDALGLDPAKLGTFDRIISLETIEHLAQPERFLDVLQSLLAPGGLLILSCPNDAVLGVENPYHLWRLDLAQIQSWLKARFARVACHVEMHTLGASVWPAEDVERRPEPARRAAVLTRLVDTLPYAAAPGFLFVCTDGALPPVSPVGAEMLNGFGFLYDLDRANRHMWDDLQRFRKENEHMTKIWEEQHQRIQGLEQVKDQLWQENQSLSAEVRRLANTWEEQKARIDQLEREKDRLQAEIKTIEAQRDKLAELINRCRQHPVIRALRATGMMGLLNSADAPGHSNG